MKKGKDLAQALVCVISIEVTKTTIAICNHKGEVVSDSQDIPCFREFKTQRKLKPQLFLHDISQETLGLFQRLPDKCRSNLISICVSVPGKVDTNNGIAAGDNEIWDNDVPVKEIMTEEMLINVPIIVINSTAALAKAAVHLSSELV